MAYMSVHCDRVGVTSHADNMIFLYKSTTNRSLEPMLRAGIVVIHV